MKAAAEFGVCTEDEWSYDTNLWSKRPPRSAYSSAKKNRIQKYYRVHDFEDIKAAIACQNPVVLGLHIFESFERGEVNRTGRAPMPNFEKEKYLGGHAVVACGWDNRTSQVLIRNSWGTRYGEDGYVYVPYEYFDPDLRLVVDMWTAAA